MTEAGVPCIPGYHGANQDPAFLKEEAQKIGFPVLLKAVKGGGGKGMRIASDPESFMQQLQSAKSEARSSFGNDVMLVEKYITKPRHIEVQIFADKHGSCVALGERDCSIQRRHQKILEESPAPLLEESVRQELWQKACSAALAVGYEGAGTVEFIFDNDTGEFFFMEMNTRLQVEHPVTEMITGEDLVRWQIIVAEGGSLPLNQQQIEERISTRGHAIEARIYAENPNLDFVPDSGHLTAMRNPPCSETVRIDSGFIAGDEVSAHYDPMIAKLIVRGENRESAIMKLHMALEQYQIAGVITNIEFLKRVCMTPAFIAGEVETGFIGRHKKSLFAETDTAPEVYAQAALVSYFSGAAEQQNASELDLVSQPGFGATAQNRLFTFSQTNADGSGVTASTAVKVVPIGRATFDIEVKGKRYNSVTSHWDQKQTLLTTFFPRTRIDSHVTIDTNRLTIFQQGQQYRLEKVEPDWVAKALGVKDATHSVLAPMPCKILRVEVASGDSVKKDDALVVIESMKMETTIRSPQDGIISRLVHQEGVSIANDMCSRLTGTRICVKPALLSLNSSSPLDSERLAHSPSLVGLEP